jgi:hypothetical protein
MPLDAARSADKTTSINDCFAAIGAGKDPTPGTGMPRSKLNTEPLAFEVFAAKHLAKIANAREKKAITAAIKAGVMFDHKAEPEPDGTTRVVYDGDVVRIDLSVGTGRAGFDLEGFVKSLLAAKVEPKLLKRLVAKHETVTASPHSFTASLVTG